MNKIEATPAVNPALAEHAARFSRKIVKTGERTHTLIGYNVANVSVIEAPELSLIHISEPTRPY